MMRPTLPAGRAWRLVRRYHEAAWRLGVRPEEWKAPTNISSGHQWAWQCLLKTARWDGPAAQAALPDVRRMRKALADLARELRKHR